MPLNGNLNNQGLSPQTTTVTSTPVWATTGKIGAKSLYTKTRNTTMSFTGLVGVTSYTVAYWLYIPTATAPTAWSDMFGIQFNCGGTNAWERDERRAATTTGRHNYHLAKSGSEGANTNTYYGTIEDDTANDNWIHVAMVKDNTSARLYFNGSLVHTVAVANFENSPRAMTGAVYLGDNGCEGYLNDFRIYDTALSPREVAEIAKGLVLHYPLNREGFGQDNLVVSYRNSGNMSAYSTTISSQVYEADTEVPSGYHNKVTIGTASGTGGIYWVGTTTNGDLGTQISQLTVDAWYTVSYYIKSNKTHSSVITTTAEFLKNISFIERPTINTGWQRVVFKGQYNGNTTTNKAITIYEGSKWTSGELVYVSSLKVEAGQKMTHWTPNSSDTIYSAMGLNSNIVYDCSGYKHDGTASGNITYKSDTPRYSVSTVFSGSEHICAGQLFIKDELTYSWWAYVDDWTTTNGGAMVCSIEGGGMGNQNAGSTFLWFICGTGTTSNDYGSGYQMPTPSAGWHMFTETWDGYSFKVYLDGELKFTNTRYTTKTPMFYNANYNALFIGGESSGSLTTPADHFIGKMSDVRVYATALTAQQVLELYQTPISLAYNGVLLSAELQE